ncbi:YceI family protein [Pelomonas sp. APW6]|uniref:YceI family protein n=1 Tax=Roseateles subflavus TaxID=3053353 RepID=A0ABT7LBV9_9BURK|nr:YceI family protein [Pelomonas sp. APW6]MDL5030353.1 YceI family protein [Pelomonas sp. APW6]
MKTSLTAALLLSLGLISAPALAQKPKAAPAAPAAAAAAAPALVAAQSDLSFVSKQMGVPVDGKFKRFEAQLGFDPKKAEAGKVQFTIDLASVTLGDPMLDAELAKPAWFDSKKLGQASFVSSAIKPLGGNRFEVAGKLSLKGLQRDITVPITLAQDKGLTTASGSFVLKRLDFKIGDGEWSDTSMVANEVTVKLKLVFSGVAPL